MQRCVHGLQSYLSSLLEPYEDPENSNVTVGFNKEVTLENGIYFNDSFQDEADVEKELSGVQQQEKIYTVGAGRHAVEHRPEKRPDLPGAVRAEPQFQRRTAE